MVIACSLSLALKNRFAVKGKNGQGTASGTQAKTSVREEHQALRGLGPTEASKQTLSKHVVEI